MAETAGERRAEGHRVRASVFVRALTVEAEIGVHAHEIGRRQPLIVDVELQLAHGGSTHLADTVDYETIAERARELAARGHIGLVETYARRLALACLEPPQVRRVRVRVEKPGALAPHAEAAGVEIVIDRD